MRPLLILFSCCNLLAACSLTTKMKRSAQTLILQDSLLQTAHIGISIFEPATGRWWYNWQGDKYFVPASNVKIATCYAAMRYLGDSLVGLRYADNKPQPNQGIVMVNPDSNLFVKPTGDPTFLHPDFKDQKVLAFLRAQNKPILVDLSDWREKAWGSGWSWNDYSEAYMAERSAMPLYGNVARFTGRLSALKVVPGRFVAGTVLDSAADWNLFATSIGRDMAQNRFYVTARSTANNIVTVPYTTSDSLVLRLLQDTVKTMVWQSRLGVNGKDASLKVIHSQPTDSLLKPLMHRSDNFFAEQALLMVSNEVLGYMNDADIMDTILKTSLANLPQKPRWADGSGLSRYNLFTPQSLVAILQKMQNEFGMKRIKEILPAGNEGTLSQYYKADSTFLYAKTGSLSGVVALSGFLTTKKEKELIFSILVNHHQASSTGVRRAIERFLQSLRQAF